MRNLQEELVKVFGDELITENEANDIRWAIRRDVKDMLQDFKKELLEELASQQVETVNLEKGVRVRINQHGYDGMNGTIVAVEEPYYEVKIDNMEDPLHFKAQYLKPFPNHAQPAIAPEPPAQPAFAVGTRVRVVGRYVEGKEGTIKAVFPDAYDVVIPDLSALPLPFTQDELEPLSEPAPMGAPSLPEGVTLSARSTSDTDIYNIKADGVSDGAFRLEYTHSSALFGLHYSDEHTYLEREELQRLVALGQFLLGESANNGR
jgi:hypothetical protein